MESSVFNEHTTVCDECDWVNHIPNMSEGERFCCARCGHSLFSLVKKRLDKILAFASSALVMMLLSFCFPFLSFSAGGVGREITLFDGMGVLLGQHYLFLGSLVALALFVFPFCYLVSAVYLALYMKRNSHHRLKHWLIRLLVAIQPWLMVDVFLVGVLVALIKMHSLASVELNLSFWAFCGYVICLLKTILLIDRRWLWNKALGAAKYYPVKAASALSQGMQGCRYCGAISPLTHQHCDRCGHRMHSRHPRSISTTVALLVAALFLYIPANLFPIMQTTFLGISEPSTILGGVFLLWGMGSYPIAIIILIASVFIPVVKILALGWLCWQSYRPNKLAIKQKHKMYKITELVGRWSMIDIFVVITLTSLVQLGSVMNVLPGTAAISFACVVILTMLAAMAYDPRYLWDHQVET